MAVLGACLRKYLNCRTSSRLVDWVFAATAFNCSNGQIQSVRWKGSQRYRLPPTAKEKERKKPRKKLTAEELMSPKELKEFLERVPKDDVWIQKYYPPARYTFEEAVTMHRELGAPEMQNNMDGLLFIDADLDLSTKKKTKFLGVIEGTVLLPHKFDDSVQSRVVAVTKAEEDKAKASQLGALFVGGLDTIRLIEKGEIKQDDFDHVVLNMDMLVEAALIKKTLKDRFPTKKKGNLGTNIEAMVELFVNGRSFDSVKMSDSVGKLTFAFGKLNMDLELLKANLKSIVEAIASQKPPTIGGPIFTKVRITCPPSNEAFLIEDESVLPRGTIVQPATVEKDEEIPEAEAEDRDEDDEDQAAKARR